MFASSRLLATLPVADMERARTWYSEKLGLEPTQVIEGEGALYVTGDGKFALYPSEFAGQNPGTALSFAVDDLAAAVRHLRAAGVTFEEFSLNDEEMVDGVLTRPSGAQGVWFTDSEGNILAVSNRRF